MAERTVPRLSSIARLLIGATLVALLVIGIKSLNIQDAIQQTLFWIQDLGPIGIVAFVLIYSLATVLFIPGSLLTLGGGAIFGFVPGFVYVFLAASLGATLAFLIGRYVARGWVAKKLEGNARFATIDRAIAREGRKIVILTRLSPVFPFNLLNYALGLTQVSLSDYLIGCLGMIPGTAMYVYFGFLAGDLASLGSSGTGDPQQQTLRWTINIIGLIATVAVTIYVTRIARQALHASVQTDVPSNPDSDTSPHT